MSLPHGCWALLNYAHAPGHQRRNGHAELDEAFFPANSSRSRLWHDGVMEPRDILGLLCRARRGRAYERHNTPDIPGRGRLQSPDHTP